MELNCKNNFFRDDNFLLVADMEFRTIRVFQGSQTFRNGEKFYPISSLASLPNMSIKINTLNVQNRPNLTPCALSEHVSNNLMIVTDLIVRTVEVFDVSEDCLTAISLSTITSDIF